MVNSGFRTSGGGGHASGPNPNLGGESAAGASPPRLAGELASGSARAPFSQAQIMHLMRTEFARARRYQLPLSCLVVQVDRIEGLTERHGSEFKAAVMRELGKLLGEKIRGADQLGMLQELSYLIILPHTESRPACVVADRLRSAFSRLAIDIDGTRIPLTLSVGVAGVQDQDSLFFDTLLSQAEVALEWATRAGGDQVSLFERDRFLKAPDRP